MLRKEGENKGREKKETMRRGKNGKRIEVMKTGNRKDAMRRGRGGEENRKV